MADLTDLLIAVDEATWYSVQIGLAEELDLPTTSWRPETPENAILHVNAGTLELAGLFIVEATRGGFLGYASGEWLTIAAADTWETDRIEAINATVPYVFTNGSATTYTIEEGDYVTVKKDGTELTYRIDGPFIIPGSGSTPAPGEVGALFARCETAGTGGNAAVGTIEVVVDALPDVTGTNPVAAVGQDREEDEHLRARARLSSGPLSPAGPAAAYEFIALSEDTLKPDGTRVDVTGVKVKEDEATGSVTCYFRSPSGPSADAAIVNQYILEHVVPQGIDYQGFSATAVVVNMSFTVYARLKDGVTASQIEAEGDRIIAAYFPTVDVEGDPPPPGYPSGTVGIFSIDELKAKISEMEPVAGKKPIYRVVSGSDVGLTEGQVATQGTTLWNVVLQ